MLMLNRRNLVLGMLILLLVVAGYLNFSYSQNVLKDKKGGAKEMGKKSAVTINDASDKDLADGESQTGDMDSIASSAGFFKEYRFQRETTRKEEVDYIREIVDNPNSEADTKNEAQAQLMEITNNMEKELNIEGLLKAKGFTDSIVMFNKDYVSVIVEKKELAPEEVAQILDIVKKESGKTAENIRIIPSAQ